MNTGNTPTPDGTAVDLAERFDEVTELVRSAGDLALRWYRDPAVVRARVENKRDGTEQGGFDPVTEADRAVEIALRDGLSALFPDHSILGEEFGVTEPDPANPARYRWTIDPIDGTRAFITGQPMWGALVGLQDGERPIAGWMHVPPLGETVVGTTIGDGMDGCRLITADWEREIGVSGLTDPADAVMLSTDPTMFAPGEQTERYNRLRDRVKLTRYAGDCLNYGLVAMGLADLVVENGLAPYDIIPLIPIVEAAGGIVTDLDGNTPMAGGYVVAASSPELHAAAIDALT